MDTHNFLPHSFRLLLKSHLTLKPGEVSQVVLVVMNLIAKAGDTGKRYSPWVWENPLVESMGAHFSILAWRIPWIEEPGRLQSMKLPRVGHG